MEREDHGHDDICFLVQINLHHAPEHVRLFIKNVILAEFLLFCLMVGIQKMDSICSITVTGI